MDSILFFWGGLGGVAIGCHFMGRAALPNPRMFPAELWTPLDTSAEPDKEARLPRKGYSEGR